MEILDESDDGVELKFQPDEKRVSEPCPDDLVFKDQPFGIAFHPSTNLIATGLVTGAVNLHKYTNERNECVVDGTVKPLHQAACRVVQFDSTGQFLYSTGTDMALNMLDCNTSQVAYRNPRIHLKPVFSMLSFAEGMLATGDEEGIVKIWDMRQQKECFSMHDNEDYVSDLSYHPGKKLLMAAGADGYLSVFNPRRGKLEARSDNMEDELLSCRWLKSGSKAVVGTQEGTLNIFTTGDWGDCSDRFPGHPESVEAMVVIDEDTIVTGSSDGMLRLVMILPNQLLGLIGEHGEFPIEGIEMSYNKSLLASSSHDNRVKFWNIDYLFDEGEEEEEEDGGGEVPMDVGDDEEVDNREKNVAVRSKMMSKKKEKKKEFFSGLE